MSGPVSGFIRSHVMGVAACFIALMGAAVVASASDSGSGASSSAAGPAKQVKKLKQKLAGFEARLAALEGKPGTTVPATLPPSGPASGDLSGAYPNPQIAPGAIVRGDLADSLDVTGASLGVGGPGSFGEPAWDGVLLSTLGIDFRANSAPTALHRRRWVCAV